MQELDAVEWFCNVGKKDSDYPLILETWDGAVESCSSEGWEGLCQEAANQYASRLAERNKDRFLYWNAIAKEVKKVAIPFVIKKTAKVVKDNNLPTIFVDIVQWDVLHLCLEAEFSDVYPPGFFASQAYWYAKGHFPCGWDGNFPKGRLVIF
ncbi:hypothetical protein [Leeia aquatica]|uniref:Uncharacterized protein n=1 Tax=Leeia aquatica TaxID=2725557 RepID=A0A847S5I8_9NEIS|nr:hypothetical protein [Leeia aquatica]NLR74367.1 hypothetical protein [Leeia aquatica]